MLFSEGCLFLEFAGFSCSAVNAVRAAGGLLTRSGKASLGRHRPLLRGKKLAPFSCTRSWEYSCFLFRAVNLPSSRITNAWTSACFL